MSDQTYDDVLTQIKVVRVRGPRRGLWLSVRLTAATCIVLVTSIVVYPMLPRKYSATADLLLRPTNQEGATTWDQSIRDALDDNAIQTKIDILRSWPLQMGVLEQHDLMTVSEFNPTLRPSKIRQIAADYPWLSAWLPPRRSDVALTESTLANRLVVKRERKSYLMQIGYESEDPQKAAMLTNTLVDLFIADQVRRKRQSHEEILNSLDERVASLEARYHRDEQAQHDFEVTTNLVHTEEKLSMQQQVLALSTAVADAHRRWVDATSHAEMLLAQQHGGNVDNTSEALASPMLQRLREKLVTMTTGAGPGNAPSSATTGVLAYLRQGIESEDQHLVKAAQNDVAVAQQAEASLRAEIAGLDNRLVIWSANERKRDDLHRAVQTDLDAIAGANTRYMLEAGRGDVLQTDVEIVSRSGIPDHPSFPNPLLYVLGTITLIVLLDGLMLIPTLRAAAARAR